MQSSVYAHPASKLEMGFLKAFCYHLPYVQICTIENTATIYSLVLEATLSEISHHTHVILKTALFFKAFAVAETCQKYYYYSAIIILTSHLMQ